MTGVARDETQLVVDKAGVTEIVACERNGRGFGYPFNESPAVLDLDTGTATAVMTPDEGFDIGRYRTLVIGIDGRTAAVVAHRSPQDDPFDGVDEILSRQIYAVTLD